MEESDRQSLGRRLRELRLGRGLTQAAVAQRLGRPQSMVARWELSDRDPTPHDLLALCDALDVDPDEMLPGALSASSMRNRASRGVAPGDRVAIGLRLRSARRALGLDEMQVFERTGIRPYDLRRIEEARGGYPIATVLVLLALYGLRLPELSPRRHSRG